MNADWLLSNETHLADGHDFDGGGVLVIVGVAVGVVRDEPLGVLGADRHHRGEELHEFPVVGVLLDLQFSEVLMHASITNEIDKIWKSSPSPSLAPDSDPKKKSSPSALGWMAEHSLVASYLMSSCSR